LAALPVTAALHEDIEHMAILIDCTPQVIVLALDGQHDFVEVPFVAALRLTPAQLIGISLAKFKRPLTNRLVRDDDAATGHQFLNVAKAQRKPEIEPHHVADDLGRVAKAAVRSGIFHTATLQKFAGRGKLTVPAGLDSTQLHKRAEVYQAARIAHPARWSGDTRNWEPVSIVRLNPDQAIKNAA
jgi:hypothetical protein